MSESISIIREKLAKAPITEYEAFIEEYKNDERAGVKAILNKAAKAVSDYDKEIKRTEKMYKFEEEYSAYTAICGIDEVGRGPLAGPVMAGAVILPRNEKMLWLNDSKQLTAKKREELCKVILEKAAAVGIGEVSNERIDEINILNATYEAMRMAISKLKISPDILFNDAVTIPQVNIRQVPIIKGDAQSASIAAASIVAKVTRDALMCEMDERYPGYGFKDNKGYGSSDHIKALKELGPTPIHRRTFIRNFI